MQRCISECLRMIESGGDIDTWWWLELHPITYLLTSNNLLSFASWFLSNRYCYIVCTHIQLYIQGLLTSHSIGRDETENIFNLRDSHAVDEGHITENDDSMVTVPPITLRQLIGPLSKSSSGWGIDLYLQTIHFLVRNISWYLDQHAITICIYITVRVHNENCVIISNHYCKYQ